MKRIRSYKRDDFIFSQYCKASIDLPFHIFRAGEEEGFVNNIGLVASTSIPRLVSIATSIYGKWFPIVEI